MFLTPASAETQQAGASYTEWPVAPALRERLACLWAAQMGARGERHVQRVIPDGCIDLLFSDGELIIAGPDTESVELQAMPDRSFSPPRTWVETRAFRAAGGAER